MQTEDFIDTKVCQESVNIYKQGIMIYIYKVFQNSIHDEYTYINMYVDMYIHAYICI